MLGGRGLTSKDTQLQLIPHQPCYLHLAQLLLWCSITCGSIAPAQLGLWAERLAQFLLLTCLRWSTCQWTTLFHLSLFVALRPFVCNCLFKNLSSLGHQTQTLRVRLTLVFAAQVIRSGGTCGGTCRVWAWSYSRFLPVTVLSCHFCVCQALGFCSVSISNV